MANLLTPFPRIFISHSTKDNDFGLRLARDLRQIIGDQEAVWFDALGSLQGGDIWWSKIVEELTKRDVFLILLSPEAMTSEWVLRELNIAINEKKRIVPLLYKPCNIRADLKIIHYISFLSPKTYEDAFNELLAVLMGNSQLSQQVPPTDTSVAFPSRQLSGLPNAAAFPPPTEVLSATSLAEPFSASNLSNSENIPPVPKKRRNSAIASNRQGFYISRTVLLIGLLLFVIASGVGTFAIIHANQLATLNATATAIAHANTPTAGTTNNDPYPPGTWKLAFYDPLSQPRYWNNGSNPSFGGSCQFNSGAYHISQSKHGNFFCAAPTNAFSNLTVEVKMMTIMGDCGGIWFRGNYSAATPAYFFGVCQNGHYGLYLYGSPISPMQTLVAGSSAAIHTGLNQSNVIAVVANGSNFNLYVNYQKINSASDSFVRSGEINFSAVDGSNPTEVAYSDARAWTP